MYQPVISIAVEPRRNVDQEKLLQVLNRIAEEDPTFLVTAEEDAYQTVVSGMGELHLDVVVRRMKEEFGIDLLVGKPQVVYRETIERQAGVEHVFEKVINNVMCMADLSLTLIPLKRGQGIAVVSRIAEDDPEFAYLSAIEEGIREAVQIGPLKGFPLTDIRIEILKASFSNPDFARLTLKMAAYEGFRKAVPGSAPHPARPYHVFDCDHAQ